MPGGDPQQGDRGTLWSPPALLPVPEGVDADAHDCDKLWLLCPTLLDCGAAPGQNFYNALMVSPISSSADSSAVVLLSGGLDSTTVCALARSDGFAVYALSFRYGQRHALELTAAQKVAESLGAVEHMIVDIDLRRFGGSALTGESEIPKARSLSEIGEGIPITYVPARNTIFLSFALAWAEVLGSQNIFLGVNYLDYSGYPDCRPEYIKAFEDMANLATRAGLRGTRFRIHAPLIQLSKAEIIRKGLGLGVDYSLTWSCYDPSPVGEACGQCDSCLLRLKGFAEIGLSDPLPYQRSGPIPQR